MKAAIFASGNGTNFEAIAKSKKLFDDGLEIKLLVCDKPNAPVIFKAKKLGIPVFINNLDDFDTRADYEREIVNVLSPLDIDYIFLAGYMRVVTNVLLDHYPNKIINIHPSLLPKFSGLNAIERAFDSGEKQTGVTIHYIDEGVDTGPIILQKIVPISNNDTVETLEKRIHENEHIMYIEVISELIKNEGENRNHEKGID
ncbi:phosphoribosylglycinamide formyltransferase [Companilactobacillus allii]|uniref:Phosphoribosylglycinamide formyltransferase n=1 Tax=Companilactobacillus allii TaxID=1847728 RepID=A0A1P8Q443_9LACO|nr:phosphoribosylglycinamide formyltransferase [Companilactobacillus allii]APX72617.1 phosphoribosylglycinamide formyltransferase [Companilactobacillus allii]USQ69721.1 phosphoribosylglycinamide formyltransferase [Companilactobacillus allii]